MSLVIPNLQLLEKRSFDALYKAYHDLGQAQLNLGQTEDFEQHEIDLVAIRDAVRNVEQQLTTCIKQAELADDQEGEF